MVYSSKCILHGVSLKKEKKKPKKKVALGMKKRKKIQKQGKIERKGGKRALSYMCFIYPLKDGNRKKKKTTTKKWVVVRAGEG